MIGAVVDQPTEVRPFSYCIKNQGVPYTVR
jgi:hypothetical protein